IDPSDIQYIDGDTDRVAFGIGTNGSRSTVIGGSALWMAADKIIAKARKLAAHLLEAAEADIEFADGNFTVAGTDRRLALGEVAKAAFRANNLPPGLEGGLYETGTFAPTDFTYPNGSHVCEVEIDAETGELDILNYVVVDEAGTVGALPAIVNAVMDALAPVSVKCFDMPATSARIWQAMADVYRDA